MIFEFFKKFFWKADQDCKKRKAESVINEENMLRKKQCHHFTSSNHVKISTDGNNELINESTHVDHPSYSYSVQEKNTDFNDIVEGKSKKVNNISSSKPFKSYKNIKFDKKKCSGTIGNDGSLNQTTLYKMNRIAEFCQYKEMLSNFIPSFQSDISTTKIFVNQTFLQKEVDKHFTVPQIDDFSSNELEKDGKSSLDSCHNLQFSIASTSNKNLRNNAENIGKQYQKDVSQLDSMVIKRVNSLRDELSTKDVTKEGIIHQITKRYDQRIEERVKELEELRKMTIILSKHNQLTRESALEDQLNRSMRLCEAILDERVIFEETKLPELTKSMMMQVEMALTAGSADEILVQEFGLKITRRDIQTLVGLNWLNDEVINFYMNLLIIRGNDPKYPSVYAMNTFFYPKLITGGHKSLKRWTRKIDIFAKDLIVIPVHLGIHWCMSIIDFRNKSIQYYDSMGSPNPKCLQILKQYLYEESIDKKRESFEFSGWNFECMKDIPQQMNGSDCGVFSCMFAEYVCASKKLDFSQDDMPYFRNKMVYEILTRKLL